MIAYVHRGTRYPERSAYFRTTDVKLMIGPDVVYFDSEREAQSAVWLLLDTA